MSAVCATSDNAIVLAQTGLAGEIARLVANIETASITEAQEAFDRIGMAREWAKLQANAEELTERLAWLEAVILRRIGQLDVKSLHSPRRAAARHFATLDLDDMAQLFADYPARSAVTVYNLYARAQRMQSARVRGAQHAVGERVDGSEADDHYVAERVVRESIKERITSVRAAAAIILDEYAHEGSRPVTVSSVVDEFIADEMPNLLSGSAFEAQAFRLGLSTAVREAFVGAPVVGACVPRFITCHVPDEDLWVRVPSEFARVEDARRFLQLRRGQVAAAQRGLENLEETFDLYDVKTRDGSDWLRKDAEAEAARAERERKFGATQGDAA